MSIERNECVEVARMRVDERGEMALIFGAILVAIILVTMVVVLVIFAVHTPDDDDGTCGCSDDPGGPIDPGLDGQDDPTAETGLSVQVQHLEGQVDATGGEMTGLSAHVALHGGADAINMLDVTVHISGMDNEPGGAKGFGSDFVHHAAPNPGGHPTYNITEVTDPLDSYQEGSEYLLDTESTLRMDFDIGGVLSDGLSPGSGVTLEFMISGGVYTTTESATTPGEYDAGAVYILK